MRLLVELERQVLSWPEVSAHPHRFGGREFRFRAAEIGHVHAGGIVDISFPRPVHDALLSTQSSQQPGTPVYAADFNAEGVRRASADASRKRPPEFQATEKSRGTYAKPA